MRVTISTPLVQVAMAISLIAIIYLLGESTDQPANKTKSSQATERQANAYIKNGVISQFSDLGHREILIKSTSAHYYKSDAIIEIAFPDITLWDNSNLEQQFYLTADTGIYNEEQQTLALNGSVRAHQITDDQTDWTIETSELLYDKKTGFISTKQQVTIKQEQQTLEALGMNAWINQRKITLLSKVRGRYEHH